MKKLFIILLVAFFLVGAYTYFKGLPSNAKEVFVPNRQCPEAWFNDKMPIIGEDPVSAEYLVVDGERKEVFEMDLEWIKENCEISKPITVF